MMRKKHRKLVMEPHRMSRTEGKVGLTRESVMSTGMSSSMAMMPMRMKRTTHCDPMMDQRRMWSTKGIVLESVKIGLYSSDL